MHPFHIPQGTIWKRNVNISVLNGALWDMGQVHFGIGELGRYSARTTTKPHTLSLGLTKTKSDHLPVEANLAKSGH